MPIPANKITLEGTTVKISQSMIGGTYEGKLSADGKTITGDWTQGPSPLPLNLTPGNSRNRMDHSPSAAKNSPHGREC